MIYVKTSENEYASSYKLQSEWDFSINHRLKVFKNWEVWKSSQQTFQPHLHIHTTLDRPGLLQGNHNFPAVFVAAILRQHTLCNSWGKFPPKVSRWSKISKFMWDVCPFDDFFKSGGVGKSGGNK